MVVVVVVYDVSMGRPDGFGFVEIFDGFVKIAGEE